LDKEITVREYQPGDEAGIIRALKASFPGWNRNPNALDYWKWKYLDSPLKAYIAVCVCEGEIVGVNHDLRLSLKVGPSTLFTHWTDDLSVLPEYRSMGLWNRMRKYRNESPEYNNLKFKFSSTSNPIVKKDWMKRGVNVFPHKLVYMIRIKDVKLHIEKKKIDDPLLATTGMSLLKSLNRLKPKKDVKKLDDYKLVEVNHFDEDIDRFWNNIKDNYNFILERKKDFVNWRFSYSLSRSFKKILAVNNNGDILGYITLRIDSRDDYLEGYIFDLLALPNRDDVVHHLQEKACAYFDEIGANVVYYRCAKGHPYQNILESNFTSIPVKDLYISYETFTSEKKEAAILKNSKKSEISLSYADTF
jgi:hypothetical protein